MTEVLFLVALAAARGPADGALDPVFDDLTGRAGVPGVVWEPFPTSRASGPFAAPRPG